MEDLDGWMDGWMVGRKDAWMDAEIFCPLLLPFLKPQESVTIRIRPSPFVAQEESNLHDRLKYHMNKLYWQMAMTQPSIIYFGPRTHRGP